MTILILSLSFVVKWIGRQGQMLFKCRVQLLGRGRLCRGGRRYLCLRRHVIVTRRISTLHLLNPGNLKWRLLVGEQALLFNCLLSGSNSLKLQLFRNGPRTLDNPLRNLPRGKKLIKNCCPHMIPLCRKRK